MRTTIRKWGNSLAVRIPKAFVKEARVGYGAAIDLSVEDGRIVIARLPKPEYRLDDLLKAVTGRNRHAGVETGRPVGREAW